MDITIDTADLLLVNSTLFKSENQRPNIIEIRLINNIKYINKHTIKKIIKFMLLTQARCRKQ